MDSAEAQARQATARGATFCLESALEKKGRSMQGLRVAVQGFGNVGAYFAKFIAEQGATVVAISDSSGGIYNPNGLDVAAAFAHKRGGGSLSELKGGEHITNDELIALDCDVFAPCALEQVVTETTGHAESVEVIYYPSRITYGQLLRIYFSVVHDQTQLNRQGPGVGRSYRSEIFYTNEEQRRLAKAYIAQLDTQKVFPKPIVTEVTPLKAFYRAEDYHQDYAYHNPNNPYIEVCDRPKIAALKEQFPELFLDYKPTK